MVKLCHALTHLCRNERDAEGNPIKNIGELFKARYGFEVDEYGMFFEEVSSNVADLKSEYEQYMSGVDIPVPEPPEDWKDEEEEE